MKAFIKLAEMNKAFYMASRAHMIAQETKDQEAIEDARYSMQCREEELAKFCGSKRMSNEFDKYENRKDEVAVALKQAGFDTAVMDFFG